MINELIVLGTAAAPISELRGAIPLGLHGFDFSLAKTLTLSILGNFLPVPIILYFLEPVEKILRKNRHFNRFFEWLYARTRRKFTGDYEKWGSLALVIFVGIPLPMTGAWSGVLAAYLFGIPKKKAAFLVFLGILIAAMIVTLLDTGIANGLKLF